MHFSAWELFLVVGPYFVLCCRPEVQRNSCLPSPASLNPWLLRFFIGSWTFLCEFKFHFPLVIASLVMHPVLAAVSSSCHTTCHLTNKLLTLQSWSQSLLLQKPKLRHTATLDQVSLEGGDSLARYLFPIISLNFQLGWCSHNLRSWTGFTESINLVIFYTKLCVYVHFFFWGKK